ncbi:MarR family transcriptional regulator [Burkholderiaceae bacterium DAT-1]|nr:MarR family transcriptional regulator [Burkholderiaceae bacterium DAT-1]
MEQDHTLQFVLKLARAHAAVVRRLDARLSSIHGLSFTDFMVVHYLSETPEHKLRRSELADKLGLTASGVTRLLLPLEKIGVVGRESDPRDARVGYAVLTPAGQTLAQDARATAESICNDLTTHISSRQFDTVLQILGQLAGHA